MVRVKAHYRKGHYVRSHHRKVHSHRVGFKLLERKIYNEYRRKGYGKKRSRYIARATAGKVARSRR